MKLTPPKVITWWVAVILGVLALLGHFKTISALTPYDFWFAIAGGGDTRKEPLAVQVCEPRGREPVRATQGSTFPPIRLAASVGMAVLFVNQCTIVASRCG
jgi:hypothetical protein